VKRNPVFVRFVFARYSAVCPRHETSSSRPAAVFGNAAHNVADRHRSPPGTPGGNLPAFHQLFPQLFPPTRNSLPWARVWFSSRANSVSAVAGKPPQRIFPQVSDETGMRPAQDFPSSHRCPNSGPVEGPGELIDVRP